MTCKILLGIFLAIGLSIIPAFAEIDTPYKQFQNGTPLEEIQCRDSKVLMETTRNTPACVNEDTADKLQDRGWVIHTIVVTHTEDSKSKVQDMIYSGLGLANGGHTSIGFTATPVNNFQIPNSITVNQTISIPYSISWYDKQDNLLIDIDDNLPDEYYTTSIDIILGDEFTLLNNDATHVQTITDTYSPHTAKFYSIPIPFSHDITNGTIQIRMDTEMFHDVDTFWITIQRDVYAFQTYDTDTGIRIVGADKLGENYLNLFDYSNDPYGRYNTGVPLNQEHIQQHREPKTAESRSSVDPMYIPQEHWDDFAEFMRSEIQNQNITDVRNWMLTNNLTQEFVNDFFVEYPEFTKIRTNSDNSLRANSPLNFFIYGSIQTNFNTELNPAKYVKVCIYDVNPLNEFDRDILLNGETQVCELVTSTGDFSLNGINDDPDDNTNIDPRAGVLLQNDNVLQTGTRPSESSNPPQTFVDDTVNNNISQTILNLGTITLPQSFTPLYADFLSFNQAHSFFNDDINYDTPFVTIHRYPTAQYFYCESVSECNGKLDTVLINAGLTVSNILPDVNIHEYGHHIQHKLYETWA